MQCADMDTFNSCVGKTQGACDLPGQCKCDCVGATEVYQEHDSDDGVYVTGIPNLWQFPYMCDLFGANLVGCGPVALSMMYYTFAERGYSRLTKYHLASGGLQDWQDLTKTLRSDYTSGTCVGAAFVPATSASSPSARARSHVKVDGETIYTGDMAGGSVGWINHYAVITGSRRTSDGREVVYVNTGNLATDGSNQPDTVFEWKSNHKWTPLFTLSISDAPDGATFCPMDSFLPTFSGPGDVEMSNESQAVDNSDHQLTRLAGASCGIARVYHTESYTPRTTTTRACVTQHDLDTIDQTSSAINVEANQFTGGNAPDYLHQ